MDTLATAGGEEQRRAARVATGTLLRVARADWLSADARTGRGVATAHKTVADALGMHEKTVQRARALIEVLGFAATIVRGRYLTVAERGAATATHGGHQVRAASLRALTMPRPAAVENVQLPRRGSVNAKSPGLKNSPTRASARKPAAPRPGARKKASPSSSRPAPRPIELQRFAARLVDGFHRDVSDRRVPWLLNTKDGRRHIGALCDVLAEAGIDPARWSPNQLIQAIDKWHQEHARLTLAGGSRDPLRYFAWQLRQAIDPTSLTPAEEIRSRQVERDARLAEQFARREQARRERERIEADGPVIAEVIARMRAEMESQRRAARRSQSGGQS